MRTENLGTITPFIEGQFPGNEKWLISKFSDPHYGVKIKKDRVVFRHAIQARYFYKEFYLDGTYGLVDMDETKGNLSPRARSFPLQKAFLTFLKNNKVG